MKDWWRGTQQRQRCRSMEHGVATKQTARRQKSEARSQSIDRPALLLIRLLEELRPRWERLRED